jgi:hypothetical protein
MEPQQPVSQQPNEQPVPAQPVGMPASDQPAAAAPPAATPGAAPQPTGLKMSDMGKEKKIAMFLSFGSLAVFVVGLLVGFAALVGALLGVIGARKSKLIGYQTGFVAGLTGVILNALFYLVAVLT